MPTEALCETLRATLARLNTLQDELEERKEFIADCDSALNHAGAPTEAEGIPGATVSTWRRIEMLGTIIWRYRFQLESAFTRLDHLERERDAFKAQNTELILEAKIAKGFAGNCQSQMARAERRLADLEIGLKECRIEWRLQEIIGRYESVQGTEKKDHWMVPWAMHSDADGLLDDYRMKVLSILVDPSHVAAFSSPASGGAGPQTGEGKT